MPPITHTDYVREPRESGYRGIHIVVAYQERAIELQLRTGVMHAWALAAENYSQALGENLKQDGDHPIQLFLSAAAEIMELRERGADVPAALANLHESRRIDALPYLEGGTP